jgi:hypothetical protein
LNTNIIEFLYFEGCPSYKLALEYLKAIIEEEKIDTNLEMVCVDSPEEAQKVGFQGSPSIKVNGIDLEDKNDSFSFNCRLYNVDGQLTGTPSKEFIKRNLLQKLKREN